MKIRLNGQLICLSGPVNLGELVRQAQKNDRFFAVAVNRQLIRKSQLSEIFLEDGDEVELLRPTAGG